MSQLTSVPITTGPRYSDGAITLGWMPATRPEGMPYSHQSVSVGAGFGAVIMLVHPGDDGFRVGLVRQRRPLVSGGYTWEVIRGSTTDLSAAEAGREMSQESGLDAQDVTLSFLGLLHPDTGILTTTVGVWVGVVDAEQMAAADGYVEPVSGASLRWFDESELVAMMADGQITCAMSMAAVMMAEVRGVFVRDVEPVAD